MNSKKTTKTTAETPTKLSQGRRAVINRAADRQFKSRDEYLRFVHVHVFNAVCAPTFKTRRLTEKAIVDIALECARRTFEEAAHELLTGQEPSPF